MRGAFSDFKIADSSRRINRVGTALKVKFLNLKLWEWTSTASAANQADDEADCS